LSGLSVDPFFAIITRNKRAKLTLPRAFLIVYPKNKNFFSALLARRSLIFCFPATKMNNKRLPSAEKMLFQPNRGAVCFVGRANRYEAKGKSNLCDAASASRLIISPFPFELFPLQFCLSCYSGRRSFFRSQSQMSFSRFPSPHYE
jgi:hypothetical protein